MATPRPGGFPSPSLSARSERRSWGAPRNRASNSSSIPPPEAGRGIEALAIQEFLARGHVCLTGGRDHQGGPVLTFPSQTQIVEVKAQELSACLRYLAQIPSRESRQQGFSAVVDNRNGCWSNLSIVLAALQQSISTSLKQLLVISSGSSSERRLHANFKRERTNLDFEPHFIPINQLYSYVDSQQLTPDFGGSLAFNLESWLQNRLALEAFLRDVHQSSQQLDNAESQIVRSLQLDEKASPREILRRHQYLQDSIMNTPTKILRQGRDVLNQLQREGTSGFHNDASTLDNLESQRQVKRMIQYLEVKVDKVQEFLDDQDQALSHNVQFSELESGFKKVVNWVLGPGEKLLASQVDIGESCEAAEELRRRHEEIELKCTNTYGEYAEFRHVAEEMIKQDHLSKEDIISQRDYMDTVCRSFATRLERRRTLLINSVRFHRLAEQFSEKLDDLLELLCTDVDIDDVDTAEEAIKTLQEKCDSVDSTGENTLVVGQSLLDELSIPIKNAFGKDITPDHDKHIKYISRKLEELQERKMRCDELADVRRLKLQQILQLRTCERDAEQAINWINELCDTMMATQQEMGQTSHEAQNLQSQHKNFQSTALGTYEYGKQLLQAALVLRRSLRYDLNPNQEQLERLEAAWKRFSQGTHERAGRLTVAAAYMASADKLLNRIDQLNVILQQPQGLTPAQIVEKYTPTHEDILKDHKETEHMSSALHDRLSLPILSFDGKNKRLSIDDEGARDTIRNKQKRVNRKLGELEKRWARVMDIVAQQAKPHSQSLTNLTAPIPAKRHSLFQNGRRSAAETPLQTGSLRNLAVGSDFLDGGSSPQSSGHHHRFPSDGNLSSPVPQRSQSALQISHGHAGSPGSRSPRTSMSQQVLPGSQRSSLALPSSQRSSLALPSSQGSSLARSPHPGDVVRQQAYQQLASAPYEGQRSPASPSGSHGTKENGDKLLAEMEKREIVGITEPVWTI
ncbi:SEC14 domain and spectrin repeat-containing protein 1-B-like [Liolophura sinensis]|uniref:SEC14 domain and spectrin repeat-containing protein 1-B-like n=1 Tax=Liolophura sinensis TaxID=3198878 RepID=UPI0031595614